MDARQRGGKGDSIYGFMDYLKWTAQFMDARQSSDKMENSVYGKSRETVLLSGQLNLWVQGRVQHCRWTDSSLCVTNFVRSCSLTGSLKRPPNRFSVQFFTQLNQCKTFFDHKDRTGTF